MRTIHRIRERVAATRRQGAAVLLGALVLQTSACDSFLDVNDNPNAPEVVAPNLLLAPMLHWVAEAEQEDGRFIGRYTQQWTLPPATVGGALGTWDRMGYDPGSDNAAWLYRNVYWSFGNNLTDMIKLAEAEQRWDLAGLGYVLRAWGWLKLTNLHGELIVSQAFTPDKFNFDFDTQEYAYEEVFRLLAKGMEYLQRTDGTIDPAYVAVGDRLFNGSASRWLKFAYGLQALALNQFSNKSTYNPAAVIAAVDASFGSNAEDALFLFPNVEATVSNDRNWWGTSRSNLNPYRQTQFVVGLMDGTQYAGAVDPRIRVLLAPDSTGVYRGLDINVGYGSVLRERPWNLFGYFGTGAVPAGSPGKYIFDDRPRFPVMTYAQLQFVKAEAALRQGNQAMARQAYLNGISAHIDFVNARNGEIPSPTAPQITAADKAAFLAHPSIAPASITLSHIMGQKYIAQWAWAHAELWMDMRRFHYTDLDPVSGTQVFRGFALPNTYYPDNNNKPAYRLRPRFNSDYVWNRNGLAKIGGLALDYHTKPLWIIEP